MIYLKQVDKSLKSDFHSEVKWMEGKGCLEVNVKYTHKKLLFGPFNMSHSASLPSMSYLKHFELPYCWRAVQGFLSCITQYAIRQEPYTSRAVVRTSCSSDVGSKKCCLGTEAVFFSLHRPELVWSDSSWLIHCYWSIMWSNPLWLFCALGHLNSFSLSTWVTVRICCDLRAKLLHPADRSGCRNQRRPRPPRFDLITDWYTK